MRALLAAAAMAASFALPAQAKNWYAGNGSYGSLSVSSGRSESTTTTNITGAVAPGAVVVPVASITGFKNGDLVLLIQLFGVGAGNYELNRLAGAGGGNLVLSTGTKLGYDATGARVFVVNEYSDVSMTGGSWNGTQGVFAIAVRGSFTMNNGTIGGSGMGFAGGLGGSAMGGGTQGAGSAGGPGVISTANNGNGGGGGGGGPGGGGGGGGGNGNAAGNGGGGNFGFGGAATPAADLSTIFMGGGGGGGGANGGSGGNGGAGGGIVLVFSGGNVTVGGTGTISMGPNSGNPGGVHGGGGGGSGGSIRFVSTGTVSLGATLVTAPGGNGGTGTLGGGSNGTGGRIAVLGAANHSGTTTPAYDSSSADLVTFDDPFSPPNAITDLQVDAIVSSGLGTSTLTVQVSWTAPSADLTSLTVLNGTYSFKQNGAIFTTDAVWDGVPAVVAITTAGVAPGSRVSARIFNLTPNIDWYFAVKSTDAGGLTSALSNASARATSYFLIPAATAGNTWGAGVADLDGDGDLDPVFTNDNNLNPVALRNDGAMTFTKVDLGSSARTLRGLALGDFDRDGDPDFIAAQATTPEMFYRNDGAMSFQEGGTATNAGGQTNGVAAADFDGDGDLDYVVGLNTGAELYLVTNNGAVSWTGAIIPGTAQRVFGIAVADYDQDGRPDMFAAVDDGAGTQNSMLLHNEGGMKFSVSTLSGTQRARAGAWGDFDQDGDMDLAVGRTAGNHEVIIRNDGGVLSTAFSQNNGGDTEGVAWADYDNDGDLDLLVTNSNAEQEQVLKNIGAAVFNKQPLYGTLQDTFQGAWGDLDGDGDVEAVLAEGLGIGEGILRNDITTFNTRPSTGSFPSASFEYGTSLSTLTFKWDPGSDAEASTKSLTYSVALATLPMTLDASLLHINALGGINRFVIAPDDRIAQFGNVTRAFKVWPGDATPKHGVILSTTAAVGGPLAYETTYYFRYQTVDSGLMRSSWSSQLSYFLPDPCVTRTSVQSGLWSSAATWSGGVVPTACGDVKVSTSHIVTVDVQSAVARRVDVYGQLKFSGVASSTLSLAGDGLYVWTEGVLDMGTQATPIPAGVKATLVLSSAPSAGTHALKIMPGGNFTSYGAEKARVLLAVAGDPLLTSENTVILQQDPVANGWEQGDLVTISPTHGRGPSSVETRRITSISGNTLTLNANFSLVHHATHTVRVANLTRNVVIRSSSAFAGSGGSGYIWNLASHATGFVMARTEVANVGSAAGGSVDRGLVFDHAGGGQTISSSVIRGAGNALLVANGNGQGHRFSENVVFGASLVGLFLQNASVSGSTVSYNEFIGGANAGIYLNNNVARALISGNAVYGNSQAGLHLVTALACSAVGNTLFANDSYGAFLTSVQNSSFSNNVVYGNRQDSGWPGVYLGSASGVRVSSNTVWGERVGIWAQNGSDNSFLDNVISSSVENGLIVWTASATLISGNTVQNNGMNGILLDVSSATLVKGNLAVLNGGHGLSVRGSTSTVSLGNTFRLNGGSGLEGSQGDVATWSVGDEFHQNGVLGARFAGTRSPRMALAAVTANSQGGVGAVMGATDFLVEQSSLGYTRAGVPSGNTVSEVVFDASPSTPVVVDLVRTRLNPAPGLSVANLDQPGQALFSWSHDDSSGTLRFYGDASLTSSLDLNYSSAARGVAATSYRALRGEGHTASLASISPTNARTQLVVVERRGSLWHVDGSVSGADMRTFSGNQAGLAVPAAGTMFTLTFTEGASVREGDRVAFLLSEGTRDVNSQKSLLFGPSAPGYREGRSRLGVQTFGSMSFVGAPGFPTLVDRLPGTTYYTLLSSGAFTALRSSFANVDSDGIQFYTNNVSLGTSTFDSMGIVYATSTYLRFTQSPPVTTSYYNLTFDMSRATTPGQFAYNAMLPNFGVSDILFRRWGGAAGGEDFDNEFPGFDVAKWAPWELANAPVFPGSSTLNPSTGTLTHYWQERTATPPPLNDPGGTYELQVSSWPDFRVAYTSATAATTATIVGLWANTSWYARARVVDGIAVSTWTVLSTTWTLAQAPVALAQDQTFPLVFRSSITASWVPHPASPSSSTSFGYRLEASTAANFSGTIFSSVTSRVGEASLAAGASGSTLDENTTYYFRVGSLNNDGQPNFSALGATSTLAIPRTFDFSFPFASVWVSSAALNFTTPGPTCSFLYNCNEGYSLEASSTAFGALSPGGVVFSSRTTVPSVSSLVVTGLTAFTTYYFRLGTYNWNGSPVYADVSVSTYVTPLKPLLLPSVNGRAPSAAWGDGDGDGDLDLVAANSNGDDFLVRNNAGVFAASGYTTGATSKGAAWGDFNRDGNLDVVLAKTGNQPKVLTAIGATFSFAALSIDGTFRNAVGAAVGDIDNDGDLDIVLSGGGTGDSEMVYLNDGAGVFGSPTLLGAGISPSVALGDYDRDGDMDLAVANIGSDDILYRNDGGALTATALLTGLGGESRSLAWGDYDGDGDLDLAAGRTAGARLLRNDAGSFTSVALPVGSEASDAAAWGDFDNDGDLDLALASRSKEPVLLRNDGGTFTPLLVPGVGIGSHGVSWGDTDGDGDLDLLLGVDDSVSRESAWLRNDIPPSNTLPSAPSVGGFGASFSEFAPFSSSGTLTVSWGDGADSETPPSLRRYLVRVGTTTSGVADYLRIPKRFSVDGAAGGSWETLSSKLSSSQRGVKLTLNKETTAYIAVVTEDLVGGRSAESSELSVGLAAPRAVTDLLVVSRVTTGLAASSMTVTLTWTAPGADGTANALTGRYDLRWSTTAPLTSTMAYVGALYQVTLQTTSVAPGAPQSATFGGLDPAVTHYFALSTLDSAVGGVRSGLSNPATAFAAAETPPTSATHAGFAASAGDFDRDGDIDFVVSRAGVGADAATVLVNAGGSFTAQPVAAASGINTVGAQFVDYDLDGDLDVAVPVFGGGDFNVYRNGGGGSWATVPLSGLTNVRDSAWGDIDNDGDLDGVAFKNSTDAELILNSSGTLSLRSLTGTGAGNMTGAWADCDADGDLDLAVAKDGGLQNVWRNQGGGLSVTALTGFTGNGRGVAWGDYDNDGDVDLAISYTGGDVQLATNDGACSFSQTVLTGSGSGARMAWGDTDGDGDLDLVLARNSAAGSVVLRNDGAGAFVPLKIPGTAGSMNQPVLADFDEDGDLDLLLVSDAAGADVLVRNLTTVKNPRPQKPTLSALDLHLAYDASGSTLTVKWDAADLDGPASSAAVTYALVAAESAMSLDPLDNRRITDPSTFLLSPADASPLLGGRLRPAYKVWPGDATAKHGVALWLDKPGSRLRSDQSFNFRLQTIDQGLSHSSWSAEISTFVFVSVPPQGRAVTASSSGTLTAQYSGVPGGSSYVLEASTSSDFTTLAATQTSTAFTGSLAVSGLAVNTTYFLRAGALYRQTTAYAAAVPASTATLALPAVGAASTFTAVSSFSLTFAWGAGGNPAGTLYRVALATFMPYSDAQFFSTRPYGAPSLTVAGLLANTTYFPIVTAYNHSGIPAAEHQLGSTVTWSETPTGVYFEEVSSDTIIVAAYAPTPAFRNLDKGLSGTNVKRDSTFLGWRSARANALGVGSDLAQLRGGPASAVLGGRVYAIGGITGGSPLSTVEVFDPLTGVWSSTGAMTFGRGAAGAGSAAGRIVAAGGITSVPLKKTERFALPPGGWTSSQDLVAARYGPASFVVDDLFYAAGGLDSGDNGMSSVERYNPATDSPWTTLATPMGTARGSAAAAVLGRRVFVFGGESASEVPVTTAEEYLPDSDSWVSRAALPRARTQARAFALGGKIYVVGGQEAGSETAGVFEYDPAANVWAERMSLAAARSFPGVGVVSGRAYVFAGTGGGADLKSTEEYDPGTVNRVSGLTPNTQYQFRAKSRNILGVESAESTLVTTRTLAAVPTAVGTPFPDVQQTRLTVSFDANNNPFGTEFRVQAATSADFGGTLAVADWDLNTTTDVVSLSRNTTYYLRVQARNANNVPTGFFALGTTVTLANAPVQSPPTFSSVSLSSVTAQWGSAGNPSGTRYEAVMGRSSSDPDTSADEVAVTTASTTGAELTTLQGNTTYYLHVRGVSHAGRLTAWTLVDSTVTLPQVPAAVGSTFLDVSLTSVTAQWSANGNGAGTLYSLAATTATPFPNTFSGNVAVTTRPSGTPAASLPLMADTTYYFFVAGISHGGGVSAYIPLGSTVTRVADPASSASTFTSVTVSSFTLSWAAGTNGPGTTYEAVIETIDGVPDASVDEILVTTTSYGAPSAVFPLLTKNTTYYAYVRAKGRDSARSQYVAIGATVTLAADPTAQTPPFTSVSATGFNAQFFINGNPAATLYDAVASTSQAFPNSFSGNVSVSTRPEAGGAANFGGLQSNTTYFVFVRSVNRAGTPGAFVAVAATSTLAGALSGATVLQVSQTSAVFSWSAAANALSVTTYVVHASTSASFDGAADLFSSTVPAGGPMAVFTGLTANTTYSFRVFGVNHNGVKTSPLTLATTFTLAAPAASAVSTHAAVSQGAVSIQWSGNGNPLGSSSYTVTASTASDFSGSLDLVISTAPAFGPFAELSPLSANTTYYFKVVAKNHAGVAAAPLVLSATTTLAASPTPAGNAFLDVGVSSASVSWNRGANPVGVTRYAVLLTTSAVADVTAPQSVLLSTVAAGTTPSATPSNLTANTTYNLFVAAVNHGGTPTAFVPMATTVTYAADPAGTASTFTAVGQTTLSVQWGAAGNPSDTLYQAVVGLSAAAPDGSLDEVPVTTRPAGTPGASFTGLAANSTYYLHVRSIDREGRANGYVAFGSTATLPNPPAAAGVPFAAVTTISADGAWATGGNGPGTLYQAVMSTGASYPNSFSGNSVVSTRPFGAPGAAFGALASNATYYLHAAAFSHSGTPTAYVQVGSTVTLAAAPTGVANHFPGVFVSSLSASWGGGGNLPGTVFDVVVSSVNAVPDGSPDEVKVTTAPEGALTGLPTALEGNSTYYLFVRPVSRSGLAGAYVAFGSTQTRGRAPAAAAQAFASVASGTIAAQWSGNGNWVGSLYETAVTTGPTFPNLNSGNVTVSTRPSGVPEALFAGLSADTTYYVHARLVSHDGERSAYALVGTTVTLAAAPELSASTFPIRNTNAVSLQWSPNGNGPGTRYLAELSLNVGFSPVAASSVTVSTSARFGRRGEGADLAAGTPYFFRVRAINRAGSLSAATPAISTQTLAADDVKPSMDVRTAGDPAWRRSGGALYDADFADAGGSELQEFRVSVATDLAGTNVLAGPTVVVTGIADEVYAADWPLPGSVFTAMLEGATNYVTITAFDQAGNSSATANAFYVRKDTSAPTVVNAVVGDTVPLRASVAYDVDFVDAASGLEKAQYSVSLVQASGDAGFLGWTDIPLVAGTTAQRANWSLDFASLLDATTHWVSVRAWDVAGATTTVTDAFRVIKDTTPPTVAVTVPGSAFRSNLAAASGTAADAVGVRGTEVAYQDVASNLYWTGGAFASAVHVWFPSVGTTSWSASPTPTFVEGDAYRVIARSSDTAGNVTPTYSTATFTVDLSSPTGRFTAPTTGATIAALAAVAGTAADPLPPSLSAAGVGAVSLRLQKLADAKWWDFFNEGWAASPVSTVAAGLANWSVAPSALLRANLAHGASYYLTIRTADNAVPANAEEFHQRSATFTWSDVTAPGAVGDLAAVQGPGVGEMTVTWTATGDDGAVGTLLLPEFLIHHATFAAASFSTASAQGSLTVSTAVPGQSFSKVFTGLTPGGTYYLRVFTADSDRNWSGPSNAASGYALNAPQLKISGHVVKTSSEGVTAVQVKAYDSGGAVVSSTFTLADGSGTYVLGNIQAGVYRVEATWTAGEIASAVWIDGIAMGSVNVDFILEINYTLSTLTGTLATLSEAASTPQGFLTRAAEGNFKDSKVELMRGGALVAEVRPNPVGRWTIPNLLPGKYSVRAFNGLEFSDPQPVELGEGETQEVVFLFDPLPEASVFAFPNPARHGTTIRFLSGLPGLEAQVQIFDIAGNLVKEIPGSAMTSPSSGLTHAVWDLTNDGGESVASGVYLFMVKVRGSNGQSGKVVKKLAVVR